MKTIRHNTFETNSSSTHALSISMNNITKPTFKPISEDTVEIGIYSYGYETWKDRLSMLITYCIVRDKISKINDILELVSGFVGFPVKTVFKLEDIYINTTDDSYNRKMYQIEKDGKFFRLYEWTDEMIDDDDFDQFSEFFGNSGYGEDSAKDLVDKLENIISNQEKLLAFVFSENPISSEEYYDG